MIQGYLSAYNGTDNREQLLNSAQPLDQQSNSTYKSNAYTVQGSEYQFSITQSNQKGDNFDDSFQKAPAEQYVKETAKQLDTDSDDKSEDSSLKENDRKMGTLETAFAVMKAYCAINVLLLPLSFVNGGYLFSPLMMMFACFFETLCAVRLSSVALKYKIWTYPGIAKKAMGEKGATILRIMLALGHIQFTVGQLSFTIKSMSSTFTIWLGTAEAIPYWIFAVVILILYSPLAWIRTLESLSSAFVFSMFMIAFAVITVSVYCMQIIQENDGEPGPDLQPINKDSYFAMMGFAFFMFEGIGCMMPIMKETAVPEKFPYIVTVCLIFLCTTYICFSALCYYTWGSDLDETVVTEMLPADNKFVQLMKLLFCINLVFSYPMTNAITHTVAQEFVFGTSYGGRADRPDEKVHYWKVNILRSLILCFSLCVTVCVADQLDHVLAIAGAILGMTNVLLIPSICHYKLLAETRAQKIADTGIIIFAVFMMFFGPATIIMTW